MFLSKLSHAGVGTAFSVVGSLPNATSAIVLYLSALDVQHLHVCAPQPLEAQRSHGDEFDHHHLHIVCALQPWTPNIRTWSKLHHTIIKDHVFGILLEAAVPARNP